MTTSSIVPGPRTTRIRYAALSDDVSRVFAAVLATAVTMSLLVSAEPLVRAFRSVAERPELRNVGRSDETILGSPFAWGWILAALPLLLVIQHFVLLWLFKGRPAIGNLSAEELGDAPMGLKRAREEARENVDRYFRLGMLTLRYVPPALLLFWSILLGTGFLFARPGNVFDDAWHSRTMMEMSTAARFGAAGAYVYILLYLGQRTFLRDISVGVVCWCIVTIIAGPILAAALSRFMASSTDAGWGTLVVYFFAGLAPRHVVQVVQDRAKQLLGGTAAAQKIDPPSNQLMSIPGICPNIAERLAEEGISSVANLAMANPYGLLRNTPFDMRQVIAWMDQALLMSTLPEQWLALNKLGVTGAIDLAWCHDDEVKTLAQELALPTPDNLQATVQRLREDAQLLLLWALYQGSIGESQ